MERADVERVSVERFRRQLRRLPEARHLTPSALGVLLGVSKARSHEMKSGQTKMASLPVGVRLAAVLDVRYHSAEVQRR
jgi:hypothetical protein